MVVRKVSSSKNKGIKKKNKKENIPGTDNEKPHPALSSTSVVKTTMSFASPPNKAFIQQILLVIVALSFVFKAPTLNLRIFPAPRTTSEHPLYILYSPLTSRDARVCPPF
jgi:hypothetical protein|tara:strand:- start:4802 stop:5131 length:330 start_codon:yes stop_codon:yes gene_type:complete